MSGSTISAQLTTERLRNGFRKSKTELAENSKLNSEYHLDLVGIW